MGHTGGAADWGKTHVELTHLWKRLSHSTGRIIDFAIAFSLLTQIFTDLALPIWRL